MSRVMREGHTLELPRLPDDRVVKLPELMVSNAWFSVALIMRIGGFESDDSVSLREYEGGGDCGAGFKCGEVVGVL